MGASLLLAGSLDNASRRMQEGTPTLPEHAIPSQAKEAILKDPNVALFLHFIIEYTFRPVQEI